MKIVEFAKDHPYLTGGGVFVAGVVLVIVLASGGGETETVAAPDLSGFDPYANQNQAANAALVQSQIAGQIAAKQSDNQTAIALSENDTAYKIAMAQFTQLSNAAIITADVEKTKVAGDVTKAKYASDTTLGVSANAAATEQAKSRDGLLAAMANFDMQKYVANRNADVATTKALSEKEVALKQAQVNRELGEVAGIVATRQIRADALKNSGLTDQSLIYQALGNFVLQ